MSRILRKCALALCIAVLGAATGYAYIVFAGDAGTLSAAPFGAAWIVLFVLLAKRMQKAPEERLEKCFTALLCGMTAVYVLISCVFMRAYRYTPLWDPDAVFTGAQSWLEGSLTARGSMTYDASTYFYYFPNNLGATMVMRTWFALTRGMDAYLSACTLNMCIGAGMILSTGLCGREMGGARGGIMALTILGCTLPVWVSCAAFYTDFLSIAFPVTALLFALKAEKSKTMRKRAVYWGLFGAASGFGAMIKITVLILPIGVVLWQFLRKENRQALCLLLSAALFFGAGQFVLQKSVYPDQLDPQLAGQMNTPVQHWIMMGLAGDGYYNGYDYEFTRSFASAQEAKAAVNAEIGRRVRAYGPGGLLNHLLRKMGICLSDGTLMLSDYYDDYPVSAQWLQDLLLPGGSTYGLWKAVCGGVHMAQLALALYAAAGEMRRGGNRLSGAMYICLFGLLLFLSFWETSKRYWINFMPLMVLCAAQGACGRKKTR